MSDLPQGWQLSTTAEACALVQSGGTPKAGFVAAAGVPFLKVYNIVDQSVCFEYRPQFVAPDVHEGELRKSKIRPGDVLMNIVGPPLGKVAIVPKTYAEWNANQAITAFRPSDAVSTEWLYHFLCGGSSVQSVINETRGSAGQVNISLSQCRNFEIPLPPPAEQRRIVAKIDSLTGKSKRARDHLDHIPRLVEKYKQAILAAAFRGDLTREWRAIDARTTTTDAPEDFWAIPETWRWSTVGQIGKVSLGRQRSPVNHTGPQMRPYMRAANITWAGWNFSDVKEMNFDDRDFERFQLAKGDVLINEGSGSAKEVGKPAIWNDDIEDCCFQNTLLRVQPESCSSEYLYWYLRFCALDQKFVSSTQGVNIYHIGKDGLARFPIAVPPNEEQAEVVQRIEAALAWVDRLSADATSARKLIDHLDQAVLAKAFQGELVPQDPDDEPASVLLERIRAEREAAPRPKRGRRKAA